MPAHQDWPKNNSKYAATFGEKSALPLAPGKKLAIGESYFCLQDSSVKLTSF